MFLNKLTNDEKLAYLKLARIVALSDGELEDTEQLLLEQYALEMQVPEEPSKKKKGKKSPTKAQSDVASLFNTELLALVMGGHGLTPGGNANSADNEQEIQDLLLQFKSEKSRKIMLLELMGIVYANDEYHANEEEIIQTILDAYDYSPHLVTIYAEWAKAELALYKQGDALISL